MLSSKDAFELTSSDRFVSFLVELRFFCGLSSSMFCSFGSSTSFLRLGLLCSHDSLLSALLTFCFFFISLVRTDDRTTKFASIGLCISSVYSRLFESSRSMVLMLPSSGFSSGMPFSAPLFPALLLAASLPARAALDFLSLSESKSFYFFGDDFWLPMMFNCFIGFVLCLPGDALRIESSPEPSS